LVELLVHYTQHIGQSEEDEAEFTGLGEHGNLHRFTMRAARKPAQDPQKSRLE
jgi:hypothetical protein